RHWSSRFSSPAAFSSTSPGTGKSAMALQSCAFGGVGGFMKNVLFAAVVLVLAACGTQAPPLPPQPTGDGTGTQLPSTQGSKWGLYFEPEVQFCAEQNSLSRGGDIGRW